MANVNNPTGSIQAYAGATAPAGYLLCDGASYLQASYAALFAIIGTTFGSADGSHFNVPDARAKTMVGMTAGIAEFNALANAGGANTINIAHSHTANNHTHTGSQATTGVCSANAGKASNTGATSAATNHTHSSFSITTGNQTDAGSNSQLSASQSVLNPYNTLNWIIAI